MLHFTLHIKESIRFYGYSTIRYNAVGEFLLLKNGILETL